MYYISFTVHNNHLGGQLRYCFPMLQVKELKLSEVTGLP